MTRPVGVEARWCESCRAVTVHDLDRLTAIDGDDVTAVTCRVCGWVTDANED